MKYKKDKNQQLNVLIFNCGSSSLKYRIISMPGEQELAAGEAKRVGPKTVEPAIIIHRCEGKETSVTVDMPNHSVAFDEVMKLLSKNKKMKPDVFGHRLVHGGALFTEPTIFDEKRIAQLDQIESLAPLHNPPAFKLIKACREKRPDLPQVGVFDTAFHATIPEYARTYALPKQLGEKHGIRKYGFHGTSHQYVVEQAAQLLHVPMNEFNGVSCHLGTGGSSLCAVTKGQSINNTMGYSPLQGLVMSTRCGDLDPAVTLGLLKTNQGDINAVEKILNKQSGLLGMSGLSPDICELLNEGLNDVRRGKTEVTVHAYLWRIRKYLGAYLTLVGDSQAIVFTDTIGETVSSVREVVCSGLEIFGVKIDKNKNNNVTSLPMNIATEDSLVKILVIQTNEELSIARQVYGAMMNCSKKKEVPYEHARI